MENIITLTKEQLHKIMVDAGGLFWVLKPSEDLDEKIDEYIDNLKTNI